MEQSSNKTRELTDMAEQKKKWLWSGGGGGFHFGKGSAIVDRMLTESANHVSDNSYPASALLNLSRATQEGGGRRVAHLPPSVTERVHDKCRITLDCLLFSVWSSRKRVFTRTFSSVPRGRMHHDSASK